MRRALFASLLALFLATAPLSALSGGPTVHDVVGRDALAKGELDGLSLDAQGVLRVGPSFAATPLDVPTTWALAQLGEDLWVGSGNGALVLRVPAEGEVERLETGDGLLVTALATPWKAGVAAALFPGARIVRVGHGRPVETHATLPAEHVWALVPGRQGGLLAATGMPAAVFAIDPFGGVTKLADIDDDHARCLALSGDEVLVGTAPKGLVVSLEGQRHRIVRDLDAQEVVGLVPLADGGLLVAANSDEAGGNPQKVASLLNQVVGPTETKPGQKAQPRAALQNGRVLWIDAVGAVTTLWEEKKVAALSLVADGAGAVLGTYPAGRVFRVEPRRPTALLADLPEAEASCLLAGADGLAAVVTSNPGVLHRPQASDRGTWTSAPIDAGASARWGRASVLGTGVVKAAFRSGETEKPDDAWSDWRPFEGFEGAAGGTGTTARFLQVRLDVQGADAAVRGLSVVAAAPNRTPVVSELTVERDGQPKSGPPAAASVHVVKWKAEDPDGDRLEVNLHAQRGDAPHWIPLVEDEVLEKPQHKWDTIGLPDGVYRLRLVVSDAPDTPPGRARETTSWTSPFRVDNTAPRVQAKGRVAGDRLLVEGEAVDQPGGRIAAVRVSVDGGPWRVMAAADGLFDEAAEPFEASLDLPTSGPHDVVVQARDAKGNLGAAATVVTVR